ncbi:DNA replication licensing factor mcm5, partial [Paramuricea clavata]
MFTAEKTAKIEILAFLRCADLQEQLIAVHGTWIQTLVKSNNQSYQQILSNFARTGPRDVATHPHLCDPLNYLHTPPPCMVITCIYNDAPPHAAPRRPKNPDRKPPTILLTIEHLIAVHGSMHTIESMSNLLFIERVLQSKFISISAVTIVISGNSGLDHIIRRNKEIVYITREIFLCDTPKCSVLRKQYLKHLNFCFNILYFEKQYKLLHESYTFSMSTILFHGTISAGITTTLNTRCSVLAAANSVFGRWDETKGEENIDFMPTILSRFDMIFIVKDVHDQAKDMRLAKHVMQVHLNAAQTTQAQEGELSLNFLKKFIGYCKRKCGPRISPEAAEKLKNRYVLMRSGARDHENDTNKRINIPITV